MTTRKWHLKVALGALGGGPRATLRGLALTPPPNTLYHVEVALRAEIPGHRFAAFIRKSYSASLISLITAAWAVRGALRL